MTTPEHRCMDTDPDACWELARYGFAPVRRGPLAVTIESDSAAPPSTDLLTCACACHDGRDAPWSS